MKENNNIILGVDIGGSHIAAAAVDLKDLRIIPGTLFNERINNKDSKEEVLKNWSKLIEHCLNSSSQTACWENGEPAGIGIAIPGPFDYPLGVAMYKGNDKYDCLYGVDVRQSLSQHLNFPGKKIQFFNDASSFTMGAAIQHKAIKKRTVGLTLGTGFGAAFLIDRLPSMEDFSIPENGCLWDKPFKGAIADDFFSTRWFIKRFLQETGISCTGVKDILATGDEFIPILFKEFVQNLSIFLNPFLIKFQGETLLLGGNIARAHKYFLHDLRMALGEYLTIEIVEETETCNIIGSSFLMKKEYWTNKADIKSYF